MHASVHGTNRGIRLGYIILMSHGLNNKLQNATLNYLSRSWKPQQLCGGSL
jgi:hypothetical protein